MIDDLVEERVAIVDVGGRQDEDAYAYLSLLAISQLDRRILKFVAQFPARHRFPAMPEDVEHVFRMKREQVMHHLNQLEAMGYVEGLRLYGKLRGYVCVGFF